MCAILLLGALPLASAQQPQLEQPQLQLLSPASFEPAPMIDPAQGWIRLDIEVKDKSGTPVTGLKQQDFTVEDNGQPSAIVSFQAFDGVRDLPDAPVEIVLVIDEVNMNREEDKQHVSWQLQAAEGEAENFLRQNQGRLTQPVLIYRITGNGLSVSGQPSIDGNSLADEIAHRSEPHVLWKTPRDFGGVIPVARKMVDFNLQQSLQALGSIALEERRRPGRKLVFWLGPGWRIDGLTGGGVSDRVTELSTRLREARIALWEATEWPSYGAHGSLLPTNDFVFPAYREGVNPETHDRDVSYLALPVIAAQTGGGVVNTGHDLFARMSERAEQANRFYSLSFDPPRTNQVDEFHRLEVAVRERDLTVNTRNGYFDQPVFYDQPAADIEPVTVEQLEQVVIATRGTSDSQLAQRLSRMKLTERLSSARQSSLSSKLRGKKARLALIPLADESVFLDPPATDIVSIAPPDAATQQKMVSQVADYIATTVPRMENFFADRTTVQYQPAPPNKRQTWKTATGDSALHIGETFKAAVRFQAGKEIVEEETAKGHSPNAGALRTVGTFGPILRAVFLGATATHGELRWSRWEKGISGPLAVFRYRATTERSLYRAGAEYIRIDDTEAPFEKNAGFHGEFAMDPASGAILRLTMQADLGPRLPVDRTNIMVEYGPVLLGGNLHICPLRSVSLSRQRRIMDLHEWGEDLKVYAPFETLLNDVTFDKYHLTHSTVRLLPGFTPAS